MPEGDRCPGRPRARDPKAREERLVAHLNLHRFRGLRLRSLRWLAAASLPIWLHAHWRILPDLLAWGTFLAEGFCLSLVATYAVLEHMWARRAAESRLEPTDAVLHLAWSAMDEVRSGIWYAFAVATLLPWACVGLGRAVPASLLSPLTLAACTATPLLAGAEVVARRRAFRNAQPRAGDPGCLPWLDSAGPGPAGSVPWKHER